MDEAEVIYAEIEKYLKPEDFKRPGDVGVHELRERFGFTISRAQRWINRMDGKEGLKKIRVYDPTCEREVVVLRKVEVE